MDKEVGKIWEAMQPFYGKTGSLDEKPEPETLPGVKCTADICIHWGSGNTCHAPDGIVLEELDGHVVCKTLKRHEDIQ